MKLGQVLCMSLDSCSQFRLILLSLQKPTYNLVKCLVPTWNLLAKNEYTVAGEITDTFEGFTKSQLKQLLCLATKDTYFIFNGLRYKQSDSVAMRSPLGLPLANTFLSIGSTVFRKDFNQCFTGIMLTIFLFSSNRIITYFR